jgi:hypothetical protein
VFDPSLNPHAYSLTDWLAYDIQERDPWAPGQVGKNVSDVKLSFVYHRQDGAGAFRAQITKLKPQTRHSREAQFKAARRNQPVKREVDHVFEARIAEGQVALLLDERTLGQAPLPATSDPIQVELIHVDYRASVRINGKEVLCTTPGQYKPNVAALMEACLDGKSTPVEVRLIGEAQTCVISHISLWRDVYYLTDRPPERRPLWASPNNFPEYLARLEDDQFFVLGDNSAVSLDARFWTEPIELPKENLYVKAGVVPRRFMLGKAFFVYWPAGYAPLGFPPALVPNFGDMRFIH